MRPVLDVQEITTQIPTKRGLLTAVDNVSFSLRAGEIFGLVGESGSGKSMTCRSVLGLVPPPGKVTAGQVYYQPSGGTSQNLLELSRADLNRIRGKEIAMIFQDPIAVLNPVLRIGRQLTEGMLEHKVVPNMAAAEARAVDLLRQVGIPAPARRLRDYPHQFSGGMCQRVVIASALAAHPNLILADEPTTALDVTIQDQILKLLVKLQQELALTLLLVTHDMGVVAQTCQRVAVMYAGQIVEMTDTKTLFAAPRHPYTLGLLNCVPRMDESGNVRPLRPIPGAPPDLVNPPSGCRFHPRCPLATEECKSGDIRLRQVGPGHLSACIKADSLAGVEVWPAPAVQPIAA
jgi:peptide/nickel transport system ATP-binding protein/oligopeptide transport system ATP-binding protein